MGAAQISNQSKILSVFFWIGPVTAIGVDIFWPAGNFVNLYSYLPTLFIILICYRRHLRGWHFIPGGIKGALT